MGFIQKSKSKEPYEMLGGKGSGCLAAPFVYLIAGFVVLPSVAFLSLVIVLRESLAAWGGFIIVMGVVLWVLTLIVGAWAYVAGKRADSQKAPEAHNHYFVGSGDGGTNNKQATPEPTVTIETPEPKSLPMGGVPWVLAGNGGNSGKKKVGTIRKRA